MADNDYRLPKSHILKSRKAFRQLYSTGTRVKGSIGQIIYLPNPYKKIAFVTGRKVGSAVKRNLLKRRMREVYRHHKNKLPDNTMTIFEIFPSKSLPDYHAIESEFLNLCSKL